MRSMLRAHRYCVAFSFRVTFSRVSLEDSGRHRLQRFRREKCSKSDFECVLIEVSIIALYFNLPKLFKVVVVL